MNLCAGVIYPLYTIHVKKGRFTDPWMVDFFSWPKNQRLDPPQKKLGIAQVRALGLRNHTGFLISVALTTKHQGVGREFLTMLGISDWTLQKRGL